MKKFMTIAMAFVLAMGMTVTAFAAGSPVTSVSAGNTVTVGGKEVEVKVDVTTVEDTVSTEAATVAENTAKVAGLLGISDAAVETTIVGDVVDVTLPDDIVPTVENPVTITFQVTGVSSDDKIVVAHKKENGEWEYITPSAVSNGSVTVPFTSLSPVAFIKVTENVKADTD
ncbi:MAG: hypothetical protein NC086_10735, partial [Alistipes sp.]|nr:hypothetical protein [Alistipes sp.]